MLGLASKIDYGAERHKSSHGQKQRHQLKVLFMGERAHESMEENKMKVVRSGLG